MPQFDVLITSEATVSATVRVTARTARAAEREAIRMVRQGDVDPTWEVDEGNSREPYLADPGNCAELVQETQ